MQIQYCDVALVVHSLHELETPSGSMVVKNNLHIFMGHEFSTSSVISWWLVGVDINQFSVSLVLKKNSLHAVSDHLSTAINSNHITSHYNKANTRPCLPDSKEMNWKWIIGFPNYSSSDQWVSGGVFSWIY